MSSTAARVAGLPSPSKRASTLHVAAAALVVLAAAVWVGSATWGFSYDDAYITYRYAQNLADGEGLVFNPGERVLGTTAPGYAVLLGMLTRLTGVGPVAWGTLVGLAGLLATALSPWLLPAGQRPPWVWSVLWGLSLILARWHVELLGAETLPILGCLSLAAVAAFGSERPLAAGLLAAVAASLRFDAVLSCGVLGLALWVSGRRFPWRYFAGTLPALATVGAVTAYYGSPLPQTLAGKRGEFADRLELSYSAAEWGWLVRDFGTVGAWTLLVATSLGLAFLLRRGSLRVPLVWCALGWPLAVELFYRFVRVPFAPWYHVMTVALLLGLAVWGALSLARIASDRLSAKRELVVPALTLLLLAPVLWTSVRFLALHGGEAPDPRWQAYRDAGRFLAEHTEPGQVAMVEIGIVSYYAAEHEILDLIGLVSPVAARDGAAAAFRSETPRYVVDAELFHGRFPFLARLDDQGWRVLATFDDPASGRGAVRILERGYSSQKTASPTEMSASASTWP